jgi:hypothetical protein
LGAACWVLSAQCWVLSAGCWLVRDYLRIPYISSPSMGEAGWGCRLKRIFTLPQPLPSREGSFEIDS